MAAESPFLPIPNYAPPLHFAMPWRKPILPNAHVHRLYRSVENHGYGIATKSGQYQSRDEPRCSSKLCLSSYTMRYLIYTVGAQNRIFRVCVDDIVLRHNTNLQSW
jgi:hypothetical protein